MAMDFFDRQDNARRLTRRLVLLFALAVVAIIAALYLLLAVTLGSVWEEPAQPRGQYKVDTSRGTIEWYPEASERGVSPGHPAYGYTPPRPRRNPLWNPELLLGVALGTTLVIAAGSLYKIAELSAGGETVALMLGGRAVNPQSADPAERRLLNIVEEMSLASGVPVPPVFVLDQEPGINAFAAGHQPGDAVVAVSRGCLDYLTREELQGVMGHEFSHILNGDMRLNLRLIGVVNGILVLAIIGYYVMRSAGHASSGSSKKQGGAAGIFLFGAALCVLGYIGVFFGNLIKAAISRQREFLADAASVQFTRYPAGITGALKKIGGLDEGSRINDGHAEEISHMFFGDAFAGSFFNLFATHPPLADRIRCFEPEFDGSFPPVQPLRGLGDGLGKPSYAEAPARPARRGALPIGIPIGLPATAALSGAVSKQSTLAVVERTGRPQPEQLEQAGRLMEALPEPLVEAAREPFAARSLVYALLLSRDDTSTRARQLQALQGQIEDLAYRQTEKLSGIASWVPAASRLPLVDLTAPALKRLSPQQYAAFRKLAEALVKIDGKIDLFEYCVGQVLLSYLDVHFGLRKPPGVRYRAVSAVAEHAVVVLSVLAYAGQQQAEAAAAAFAAGAAELIPGASILPREQATLAALSGALNVLAQAAPPIKRRLLAAASTCISTDGQVTLEEDELLRAVAAAIGCPIPPAAP